MSGSAMTNPIRLSDDNLREIFALFSSPTEEEIEQIYSEKDRLFFRNEDTAEEYTLVQENGEFAKRRVASGDALSKASWL